LPFMPACRHDGLRPGAGIASPLASAAHFGALRFRCFGVRIEPAEPAARWHKQTLKWISPREYRAPD
jgi:hypothetical protein